VTFVLSAAALFLLATFVTIKYAAHKAIHAALAFLAGFFVASTGAAPYIREFVGAIARALGKL
jgi:hypothetical protein